eukprot:CAMPEP_0119358334 /NCGR_PEP_ID=MMETSP1334-20130426/6561_1 /TAXON_ID=127549 /ORGANISM="Calcidiscus leptoporus, Strain RCC1130" /LENGTH=116 /DNA_ID=CAMNT_0007372797 /DNA_START=251 /DNA_END=601 /DNA_ORIENTATION=+
MLRPRSGHEFDAAEGQGSLCKNVAAYRGNTEGECQVVDRVRLTNAPHVRCARPVALVAARGLVGVIELAVRGSGTRVAVGFGGGALHSERLEHRAPRAEVGVRGLGSPEPVQRHLV